eukprot:CAMPEP_0117567988 /NCGR_PEP_ID=MMETSP0784-20121206/57900_1 /TAXON_ID=39447 /ORGANISM="" /LENGTH=113 /DNA_ID=CAMNT_0005365895 /DNA_START=810 /DNA_END=1151 /DNA_ORIENTATION=-
MANDTILVSQCYVEFPMERPGHVLRDIEQLEGAPDPAIDVPILVQHCYHVLAAIRLKGGGEGRCGHVTILSKCMLDCELIVAKCTNPEGHLVEVLLVIRCPIQDAGKTTGKAI